MSEQCKCSVNPDSKKRLKKSRLNKILKTFITIFVVLSLIVIAYSFWLLIIFMVVVGVISVFSIGLFNKIFNKNGKV